MSVLRSRAARSVVVGTVTLLVVLLPALVAGARVDAPPAPGEIARAAAASDDPRGESGGVANLFYAPFAEESPDGDAPHARLGSLLGILAISGLTYAAVAQARGRGQAVLSCIALAMLPPVSVEGFVVRPEVPATVFVTLALTILAGMPLRLAAARRTQRFSGGWFAVIALAIAVGTASGLALASLPALLVALLIPAGCVVIAMVQHGVAYLQVLRRFRLQVLPSRAFALRFAPWVLVAFSGLVASAWLLREVANPPEPTPSAVGLWPDAWLATIPLAVLAALGAFVMLFAIGLRLGRRRRLAPEVVLAVWVIGMLVHRLRSDATEDALPSAPALAVLVAEGARVALLFGGAALTRVTGRA